MHNKELPEQVEHRWSVDAIHTCRSTLRCGVAFVLHILALLWGDAYCTRKSGQIPVASSVFGLTTQTHSLIGSFLLRTRMVVHEHEQPVPWSSSSSIGTQSLLILLDSLEGRLPSLEAVADALVDRLNQAPRVPHCVAGPLLLPL